MRESASAGLFHRLTVASVGILCLLVAAAGAVGVWAQLNNTWEHFFLMEQTFATVTPIVVVIGAFTLLVGIKAVLQIK